MKTTTRLAVAVALAGLAACSSNNSQNNADLNAAADLNAGMTDMNTTTDMNAEINVTGNSDLNATGNGADKGVRNATTNY